MEPVDKRLIQILHFFDGRFQGFEERQAKQASTLTQNDSNLQPRITGLVRMMLHRQISISPPERIERTIVVFLYQLFYSASKGKHWPAVNSCI
jgi:hypothetical protein